MCISTVTTIILVIPSASTGMIITIFATVVIFVYFNMYFPKQTINCSRYRPTIYSKRHVYVKRHVIFRDAQMLKIDSESLVCNIYNLYAKPLYLFKVDFTYLWCLTCTIKMFICNHSCSYFTRNSFHSSFYIDFKSMIFSYIAYTYLVSVKILHYFSI